MGQYALIFGYDDETRSDLPDTYLGVIKRNMKKSINLGTIDKIYLVIFPMTVLKKLYILGPQLDSAFNLSILLTRASYLFNKQMQSFFAWYSRVHYG